jgi:ribosomal protein S1
MSQKNVKGGVEPLADFYWPEFNSDSKRIKLCSKIYKDMTITEAFAEYYNLTLKQMPESVNQVPKDLRVGDIIPVRIRSIEKGRVVFDAGNIKTNIQSGVNLYRYEKLRHFLPMDELKATVTRVDKDKAVVDPLTPMISDWINPILKDPTIQKVIPNQETGAKATTIKVKDLQLTKGGFTGKAVLPNVSEFVGEDYTVDVFIPGSQIVLNITDNFEQFVGKEIDAFIINYMSKPGTNSLSLIASAKELIKFRGECKLIELFNAWCEESDVWTNFTSSAVEGRVTGVINSSKKCGVFVEIPSLSMTGLVPVEPELLVNYKTDSIVNVKITGFDEEKKYNAITKQLEHVEPYIIENDCLVRCNIKPVLTFAE